MQVANGVLACLVLLAARSGSQAAPVPEYTISTVTRLVQPYRLQDMNDEFQTAELISEKGGIGTFRITYYPLRQQRLESNPNWKRDYALMRDYLAPARAANWDEPLRLQIVADLKAAGIDPDRLDDRSLVEQVSRWAMRRSRFNDQFGLWMVLEFDEQGKPKVAADLAEAFVRNEPAGISQDEALSRELFGKQMYENRSHGACTSTACYLATVLRALGIPTRIVVVVPAADGNDPAQLEALEKGVSHHQIRQKIIAGSDRRGFSDHFFNEVYVGNRWVRLNYSRLGQGIVDNDYCGLMTHLLTVKDLSEIPLAATWGRRYALSQGPQLSSINPYQLVEVSDANTPGDNPPARELLEVRVNRWLAPGDPAMPAFVQLQPGIAGILCIEDWLEGQNYYQLRAFLKGAGHLFELQAPGLETIRLRLTGTTRSDGAGTFQGFEARLEGSPSPGVHYRLVPDNDNRPHRWQVQDSLRIRF